jgi:thiamine-monophosphate kinase
LNLENYFISQFNSKYIGDDGALIGEYVYSKDAFFENVHFKRSWMSYFQIARKAMLVNISDAVAMNAQPKYALLSVAMPKDMSKNDMRYLAAGFQSAADDFAIDIIGGDTISNTKLDITVTIISQTQRPLLRKKIRENYMFAYTGELGKSLRDLKRVQNLGKLHKNSKFVNIRLRDKFIQNSERFLKAGMDISDGLYSDLDKMTTLNRVGVDFLHKIPKNIGCSGEEYEMLIAFDKRDLKKIIRRAECSRTQLNIFANAVRNKYTNRCKAHHF